VSLALITKNLRTRNGKKKSDPSARAQKNTTKLSLLVTNALSGIRTLERFWFTLFVSCTECTSSCIGWNVWKIGCLEVLWLGGIYSPNHQSCRWEGLLSKGALDSLVRQPRHPTVRVRPLELWQVGPPDSPVVHQTGPVHCLVRLLVPSLTSARVVALFTVHCRLLQTTVGTVSRCSAGTPDSPVLHRIVRWIIAEWLPKFPKLASWR
jgi:hypothetical protein